ncbi:MAG TPA: four-helix bundle copper-binding protein [Kofleriaceae bacterium]|nr:four-helix bundle copper-binding protein [Kofleriaceae bacterium]
MQTVSQMVKTNPQAPLVPPAALIQAIETCILCEQTCSACADACLGEPDPKPLVRCVRLNLDCADVCSATARMLSRHLHADPTLLAQQVALCAIACALCAGECERHAREHEHCRVCAEMCRNCERQCREFVESRADLTPAHVPSRIGD